MTRLMELRAALDEIFSVDLADGSKVEASDVRGNSRRFKPQNLLSDDFDKYWAVVKNGTPVLKSFAKESLSHKHGKDYKRTGTEFSGAISL